MRPASRSSGAACSRAWLDNPQNADDSISPVDFDPIDWLNSTAGMDALARLGLPSWDELSRHQDIFSFFGDPDFDSVLRQAKTEESAKAVSAVLSAALDGGQLRVDQIAQIFAADLRAAESAWTPDSEQWAGKILREIQLQSKDEIAVIAGATNRAKRTANLRSKLASALTR